MEKSCLQKLIARVADGSVSVGHALERLKYLPFENVGFAMIDHHRPLRKGIPEVVFCQNKTPEQAIAIVKTQCRHGDTVFGTRANPATLAAVKRAVRGIEVDKTARCFWKKSKEWKKRGRPGSIVICSAGTADLPVVAEAQRTVELFGYTPALLTDVGVAGIHRLFSYKETLHKAAVIIAVAGMEGALPSVIAGYVASPVIGVPTSVGYGSHLGGMVPLFAMLNSCAPGLTVVNIDNGFGAACAAVAIVTSRR